MQLSKPTFFIHLLRFITVFWHSEFILYKPAETNWPLFEFLFDSLSLVYSSVFLSTVLLLSIGVNAIGVGIPNFRTSGVNKTPGVCLVPPLVLNGLPVVNVGCEWSNIKKFSYMKTIYTF